MIPFNLNYDSITVIWDRQSYTVHKTDKRFDDVLSAVKNVDNEALGKALCTADVVKQYESTIEQVFDSIDVKFEANSILVDGYALHNTISDRIIDFVDNNLPIEPLVLFVKNIMQNPSVTLLNDSIASVLGTTKGAMIDKFIDDLFSFLSKKNMPITDDGYFLAYKSVQSDYFSKSSGTLELLSGTSINGKILNKPGELIKCKREQVDQDRTNECSHGLHVGCMEYSGPGGWYNNTSDKVVVVKVNPRDVVAIPPDYNRTKMRVCEYEVLYDYLTPINTTYGSDSHDRIGELSEDDPNFWSDIDLMEGDNVNFDYCKNGVKKRRYGIVETIHYEGSNDSKIERIVCKLVEPEERAGQYGSFSTSKISNFIIKKVESEDDEEDDEEDEEDEDFYKGGNFDAYYEDDDLDMHWNDEREELN